jgi:hypothetical protein
VQFDNLSIGFVSEEKRKQNPATRGGTVAALVTRHNTRGLRAEKIIAE